MNRFFRVGVILALAHLGMGATDYQPQFGADSKLAFPKNYREWVFLSSGLGMTYGPAASHSSDDNPLFDNVFVSPAAYRAFTQIGRWPDKTIFMLEIRSSQSKGSINRAGHFQGKVVGLEAEVKDEASSGAPWKFFSFDGNPPAAAAIPASASCYSCHAQHGAVDNTFVQFYPSLKTIAQQKGTLKASTQ